LSSLIEDSERRQQIGNAAYDRVKTQWQWKDQWWRWDKLFQDYIDKGFHAQ